MRDGLAGWTRASVGGGCIRPTQSLCGFLQAIQSGPTIVYGAGRLDYFCSTWYLCPHTRVSPHCFGSKATITLSFDNTCNTTMLYWLALQCVLLKSLYLDAFQCQNISETRWLVFKGCCPCRVVQCLASLPLHLTKPSQRECPCMFHI